MLDEGTLYTLEGSEKEDYIIDMIVAQEYASLNRDIISEEIIKLISSMGIILKEEPLK